MEPESAGSKQKSFLQKSESKDQPKFYSGTSGLVLPVRNKSFYPAEFKDKSRLTYYSSLFNSVEINSSFYKIPMASTVANWSAQVPEDFKITFKLWKGITHNKALTFDPDDVDRFIQTINYAGSKKGCLLVQFPPSLKINSLPQLEKLLITIVEADPKHFWKVALEFRHSSWYHEDVYDLIDQYRFGIVIHDKPGSATPMLDSDVNFKYLRFHGPDGDYKGHYDDGFIYEYAEYVQEWIQEEKVVYAYFNNTMGDAIKNLDMLNSLMTMS